MSASPLMNLAGSGAWPSAGSAAPTVKPPANAAPPRRNSRRSGRFALMALSFAAWQPVAKVPAAFERRCIPPRRSRCNAGFHHGLLGLPAIVRRSRQYTRTPALTSPGTGCGSRDRLRGRGGPKVAGAGGSGHAGHILTGRFHMMFLQIPPDGHHPTDGFPASGSRTKYHAFAHGKLAVRDARRVSPQPCRSPFGERTRHGAFTAHLHRRSRQREHEQVVPLAGAELGGWPRRRPSDDRRNP